MKKPNEYILKPQDYIAGHFFIGLLLLAFFSLIFQPLLECTEAQSLCVLVIIAMAISTINTVIYGSHVNILCIINNITSAYTIYYLVSLIDNLKTLITMATVITLIIVIAVFILFFKRKKTISLYQIGKKIRTIVEGIGIFIMIAFILLIANSAFSIGNIKFDNDTNSLTYSNNEKYVPNQYINERNFQPNIDQLIVLLDECKWESLPNNRKLDVLKAIADTESDYLGLPYDIDVCISDSKNKLVAASYSDTEHLIRVSEDVMNYPASKVINIIAHEVFHSYEYRLADLYKKTDEELKELLIFKDSKIYINEFANYNNGDNDYQAYHNQKCEIDSRAYAEKAEKDYSVALESYRNTRDD